VPGHRLAGADPIAELFAPAARPLLLNISASPFRAGQAALASPAGRPRRRRRLGCPWCYVNQVGWQRRAGF